MSFRIGVSRIGPRVDVAYPSRGGRRLARLAMLGGACLACLGMLAVADAKQQGVDQSGPPQTASPPPVASDQHGREAQKSAAKQANGQSDMLVEAKELVYDKNTNTITAAGGAKVYYQGRVLQADKVVYYRDSKRVLAEGNAKLTDEQGNVYFGNVFELTDDFKTGFINSLLVETKDKTRFSSSRAERADGETTTFEDGTYTACEPCKEDPTRPPLWQVRAKRITDNHVNHRIYYEDAWLQFYGWPVAYMPYFSAPDPSVRRATGFLAPKFYGGSKLGFGAGLPFFWDLAPNYDLTLTPNILTQQGFLGEVEWRQRLETGSYSIRVAGIDQIDPKSFAVAPYGAADKKFRGSIESNGKFYLNENWWTGWDVAAATDKFFFYDYKIRDSSISAVDYNYQREATSSVYLSGKAGRSWFDLRGFYFETLNALDYQKQIPVAAPVLDYDRRFDGPSFLGGEVTLNANMESIHRTAGDFVDTLYRGNPLSPNYLNTYLFNTINTPNSTYGNLYNACAVYSKGACIVRGIPGDYTRASVDLSWRRRIIDDIGEVWTPFAYIKTQASFSDINQSGYNNANIANFISPEQSFGTRSMPAIGLEYRYPFVATSDWGTSTIEPIGEIVARPSESRIGRLANEDAQSLVFDDTTLFQADKFSGYDRMEGGTRANVGAQYTFVSKGGGYYNALFGESYQLAGTNSFSVGDLTNTGLDSGLDTRRSDYVGRIVVQPAPWFSTTARGRFDESSFAAERLEITTSFSPFQAVDWFADNKSLRSISFNGTYAHIAAQPELAQPYRRNALSLSTSWNVYGDWTLGYGIVFDLSHHLDPTVVYSPVLAINELHYSHGLYAPAASSLSAQYKNDCCTFKAQYVTGYVPSTFGVRQKSETLLFTLELRTLGAVNYSTNVTGLVSPTDEIGGR